MAERSDENVFRVALADLQEMEDAAVAAGLELTRARTLRRGEHVLRAGDRATEVTFVVQGVLREYYLLPHGTERTKSFVIEDQISGSLPDLLSGRASRANIVAEEPTRLLSAPYAGLTALAERHADWAALARSATERLLLRKTEREYELLALDADQRYDAFRARFPGLEARVAARHVASYVGITPVHLSRLRRGRRERSTR